MQYALSCIHHIRMPYNIPEIIESNKPVAPINPLYLPRIPLFTSCLPLQGYTYKGIQGYAKVYEGFTRVLIGGKGYIQFLGCCMAFLHGVYNP